MELGLLGSIAYLGGRESSDKTSNIDKNNNEFSENNIKHIYSNNSEQKNNQIITNLVKDRIDKSNDPLKSNLINTKIKDLNQINKILPNNKVMNKEFYNNQVSGLDDSRLFEPFNNENKKISNNSNFSYSNQFKPLLFDTENGPKAKNISHKTQDISKMSSIERSLAIDGGWSAFENSNYDMTLKVNDPEKLTHNNMVPHFRNNGPMINDYNEQNMSHKVELFSGSSKNFIPKKELEMENFVPMEANITNVNGQENFLDKVEGHYIPGALRTNEKPFEPVKVGPGLNLDPSQTHRPDGGVQENFRNLPKSVDNLRSSDNPKVTYEARVVDGQKGSKRSQIGSVYKHGPEKTKALQRDDLQKSGGAYRKPTNRDKVIIKNTNRENFKQFIGPATYEVNKVISSESSNGKVQKTKKQQLKSQSSSGMKYPVTKNNPNKKSYNLPETERDSTQYNEHPQGIHRSEYGSNVYNPNDTTKQTVKQTTIYTPHTGVTKGPNNKISSYNPEDTARATTKETTSHNNYVSNFGRVDLQKVKSFDPSQVVNPTHREATTHNVYDGGFQSSVKSVSSYDPNNLAKTTMRGISGISKDIGNMGRNDTNTLIAHDPNQQLRNTNREIDSHNKYEGVTRGPVNKGESYDPSQVPGTTNRETTQVNSYDSNVRGPVNKGESYDPSQIFNTTNRETTSINSQLVNARNQVDKVRTYDPSQTARDTIKELSIHSKNVTNIKSEVDYPHHYDPSDILNTTQRETTIFNNYDGGMSGPNNKVTTYNPNDLAKVTTKEQTIYDDRKGTGRGPIDKPHYYDPNDEARTTVKQTTLYSDHGNIKSAYDKPHVFDPNNIPATTLKDLLVKQYNMGVAQGTINKSTAFNPNDIPADTLKQLLVINNYVSNANRESGTGYLSNKFTIPETLRQLMNILRSGGLKGNELPSSYTAEKNMEQNPRREILSQSREPTNRSHDNAPTVETVGIPKLKEQINIQRDPIRNNGNHIGNNYYIPSVHTKNNFRQEEDNRLDPEILSQLIDNPLVNNIVNKRDVDN